MHAGYRSRRSSSHHVLKGIRILRGWADIGDRAGRRPQQLFKYYIQDESARSPASAAQTFGGLQFGGCSSASIPTGSRNVGLTVTDVIARSTNRTHNRSGRMGRTGTARDPVHDPGHRRRPPHDAEEFANISFRGAARWVGAPISDVGNGPSRIAELPTT